jgi:histidinol-phosphate aminotransferase
MQEYVREVKKSKSLVYGACDRLGLKCWQSDANFVLIRIGDRVGEVIAGARARGVYLRDRSSEPGCEGCLRFGAGWVDHTQRALAVIEEVLCGAG